MTARVVFVTFFAFSQLLFPFLFFPPASFLTAQIGGNSTYNFLKIPTSARSAALGRNTITANDSDFALVIDNPSVLNASMHNNFTLNYINYLSDINLGYIGYARNFKTIGTVAAGLQYLNYGKFIETDIYDQKLGEFSASDYALNLSFSKMLHPQVFTGGTIKGIFSSLKENKSFGVAADLAGTFLSKDNSFIAAVILKNMGAQIKTYTPGIREPLPFEAQLGISKKIKYAPVRIYYSLRNLQKWNLMNPEILNSSKLSEKNEAYKKGYALGYNFAMHSLLGIEFMPVKSFSLRFGYEPKKRSEMKLIDRSGLTGFSFGAGIRILKMNFGYARSSYHLSGASNHITLTMNLLGFATKKNSGILFEEINP